MRKLYFILLFAVRFPIYLLKKNNIHFSTRVSSNSKIARSTIGKYCYIANNTNIVNTQIGNYCSIAPGVQIGGMEHSHWWLSMSTFLSNKCRANMRTIIEEDVWIAAGAIIRQGVTIGRGSVIGAMSFVNKDVPPNTIVVGIPAKVIKQRLDSGIFEKLEFSEYWKYKPSQAKEILNKIQK